MELRKKSVSISFCGDDDVVQHIYPLNDKKKSLGRTRKVEKKPGYEYITDSEDEADKSVEEIFRPSTALTDEAITGGDVYQFNTPKRAQQMLKRATDSAKAATPKTPRTPTRRATVSDSPRTPTSRRRSEAAPRTPKSSKVMTPTRPQTPKSAIKKKTRAQALAETGNTPATKRTQRRKQQISAMTPQRITRRQNEDIDSDTSVEYDSDDSEFSAHSEEASPLKLSLIKNQLNEPSPLASPLKKISEPSPLATPLAVTPTRKSKRKKVEDDVVGADTVESYFEVQSMTGRTSDRTLSRLETPRMNHEELNDALCGVALGYEVERGSLYKQHQALFNKWMYLMCTGFNLLCHGVGSKRHLLENFRKTMLKDFSHVVVNGYFPSLTIKNILNGITEEILCEQTSFRSHVEQCEYIQQYFESNEYQDFFLLIHNIDGPMLRGDKAQLILSLLAQVRGFHIVASIDHINAPLIWDQTKSSRFNWLWQDVTTYSPYTEETSYENSLLVQQAGTLALSSLTHVMRSLTPNAKGIFFILVNYQLEHIEDGNYNGLSFPDLYQKCREDFLVNSDLTLRTQLTEFKDHKLIRLKKGLDGVDYLTIPLDEATLKEFMKQQEDS